MNIGRTRWWVGGASNVKHTNTHTHSVPRYTQDGWSFGQRSDAILTHVSAARPLIKLMGYENRENAVCGWGSRQWQTNTNIHTHTHKHTHSVPRDTQVGWSLGKLSEAILTHASVARPLIKLMDYKHRGEAVGGGGSRQWQTHTHTMSPVIHRVDGASGNDRMQY